jgi:hypothetical protein
MAGIGDFLKRIAGSIVSRRPEALGTASRDVDRERGTPRDASDPTPPGIRVAYHGGSTGLSYDAAGAAGAHGQSAGPNAAISVRA